MKVAELGEHLQYLLVIHSYQRTSCTMYCRYCAPRAGLGGMLPLRCGWATSFHHRRRRRLLKAHRPQKVATNHAAPKEEVVAYPHPLIVFQGESQRSTAGNTARLATEVRAVTSLIYSLSCLLRPFVAASRCVAASFGGPTYCGRLGRNPCCHHASCHFYHYFTALFWVIRLLP